MPIDIREACRRADKILAARAEEAKPMTDASKAPKPDEAAARLCAEGWAHRDAHKPFTVADFSAGNLARCHLAVLSRIAELERERDNLQGEHERLEAAFRAQTTRWSDAKQRAEVAEQRLATARAALMLWIDEGELHEDDCPQDDTCGCKVATAVNDALAVRGEAPAQEGQRP